MRLYTCILCKTQWVNENYHYCPKCGYGIRYVDSDEEDQEEVTPYEEYLRRLRELKE